MNGKLFRYSIYVMGGIGLWFFIFSLLAVRSVALAEIYLVLTVAWIGALAVSLVYVVSKEITK